MFFNLEEIGLKGSAEYVKKTKAKWASGEETIVGMVSLEMLGYFTDKPGSQRSPIPAIEGVFDPPTVGDFIAIGTTKKHAWFARRLDEEMRRAAPGLKIVAPDFLPDLPLTPPDLMRSDNGPFLWANVPAVMLTDTSNYRNPNYHRPTDTIETLDPERYTLVVRGLAGAVKAIAGEIEDAGAPTP
jgi:Zn-dependent M28 family amino/carboxypeptidase